MKRYFVGVCDNEPAYVVNLMEYINSKKDSTYTVVAFTTYKAVCEYLVERQLDLLVINKSLIVVGSENDAGTKISLPIVNLVEELDDINLGISNDNPREQIFKYQSMEQIYLKIKDSLRPRIINIAHNINRVYGVYSPIGRSGKTLFSKGLCLSDIVRGSLYISLDNYLDENIEPCEDILFLVKRRDESIIEHLEKSSFRENEINMCYPSSSHLEVKELDYEDWKWLVNILMNNSKYSTVVFDIGGGSISSLKILDLFHMVFLPILKDDKSQTKTSNFFKIMNKENILTSNIVKVSVSNVDYASNQMMIYIEKVLREVRD